jgi:hypothetical protein
MAFVVPERRNGSLGPDWFAAKMLIPGQEHWSAAQTCATGYTVWTSGG